MVSITPIRPSTAAAWQAEVGALGATVEGLPELLQAVRILLMTPTGSVPHRPDFGCDLWRWIDRPFAVAQLNVSHAVVAAITTFEPRVTIVSVLVRPQPSGVSGFVVSVAVQPVGDEQEQLLVLSLPSGDVLPAAA
jgi:hypothetical protein